MTMDQRAQLNQTAYGYDYRGILNNKFAQDKSKVLQYRIRTMQMPRNMLSNTLPNIKALADRFHFRD
jgi:hypothetical protein